MTDAAMQTVKRSYCQQLMTSYHQKVDNPKYLINIDETCVHLNRTPNKGENSGNYDW